MFTERWASAKQLEQKKAHDAHCKHLYFASLAHVMQVWLLGMELHSMKVFSIETRFFSQAAVAAFCFMLWRLGPLWSWSKSSMISIGDSPSSDFSTLPASPALLSVIGAAWTAGTGTSHSTWNSTVPYFPLCWSLSQLQWRQLHSHLVSHDCGQCLRLIQYGCALHAVQPDRGDPGHEIPQRKGYYFYRKPHSTLDTV